MLIQNDLVVHDIEGIYRTTTKGIRFLETSRQLGGLLVPSSQQKQVDTICLMMQRIPSRHAPVQGVAGRAGLAEDVNLKRYCGSI